jgi:hypothetical protein
MTFRPPPTPSDARSATTQDLIALKATDMARWSRDDNLATQWDERAKLASGLIGAGRSRILDVGAGAMTLRSFLPAECEYIPADVVARCDGCLVVDLNKEEFPPGRYDFVSFLGVLEYIHEPKWALAMAARAAPGLIVSYCTDISGDLGYRRGLGWVNDFTKTAFEQILQETGWSPVDCLAYKQSATNAQYIWKCAGTDAP